MTTNATTSTGTGALFVVSAPSGAGKTSLVRALIDSVPQVGVSVSHTTRPRRRDESDGVNYHFIDEATFRAMERAGEFVESAVVFGNYYGTSRGEIDRITREGKHVILEIDWQGARQVRATIGATQSIFILPPSTTELRARLQSRGQDDEATIARRTEEARDEMSHYHEFDYVVVNDDFDEALAQLVDIVKGRGEELAIGAQKERLARLIADLLP